MSIFSSAEVRWIIKGAVPEKVWKWFAGNKFVDGPDDRDDHYMMLDGVRTLGIKWREGKLEFKPLIRSCGVLNFGGRATGRLETWEKWSSKGLAAESVRDVPNMIVVEKSRMLRKFVYVDNTVSEVHATERPKDACNVELTKLRVKNREFWTFGFEAFADPEKNATILSHTAERILRGNDVPSGFVSCLTDAVTHSYPSWLADTFA